MSPAGAPVSPWTDGEDARCIECSLLSLQSRAGSDSSEWPEDLRVQEWPR